MIGHFPSRGLPRKIEIIFQGCIWWNMLARLKAVRNQVNLVQNASQRASQLERRSGKPGFSNRPSTEIINWQTDRQTAQTSQGPSLLVLGFGTGLFIQTSHTLTLILGDCRMGDNQLCSNIATMNLGVTNSSQISKGGCCKEEKNSKTHNKMQLWIALIKALYTRQGFIYDSMTSG